VIELQLFDILERHIGKGRQIGVRDMYILDAKRGLWIRDAFDEHSRSSLHILDGGRKFEVIRK
jgi:hypothetical protein